MVHISILLGLASLSSAGELLGFNAHKGLQANLLFPGTNSAAFSIRAVCSSSEKVCDDECIPSESYCCFDGDAHFCDKGTYCDNGGCCKDGDICIDDTAGCREGRELCGDRCMPTSSTCCDESKGVFCDTDQICTSDGACEYETDGAKPGSGGGNGLCNSPQVECDGYCMPEDAVCCGDGGGNGGYYCDNGEMCNDDFSCSPDDGSGDNEASSSPDPPYSMPTVQVGGGNGDDEQTEEEEEDESLLCKRQRKGGGGSGGGSGGGDGDDECAASGMAVPVILAGMVAALPFAL